MPKSLNCNSRSYDAPVRLLDVGQLLPAFGQATLHNLAKARVSHGFALSNDPLEQKVLTCWRSMESIASSNHFLDDGACK